MRKSHSYQFANFSNHTQLNGTAIPWILTMNELLNLHNHLAAAILTFRVGIKIAGNVDVESLPDHTVETRVALCTLLCNEQSHAKTMQFCRLCGNLTYLPSDQYQA